MTSALFNQPWTPFLADACSQVCLDDAGLGLPCLMLKTNNAWASHLRGPGLLARVTGDPGHAGWVPNPWVPRPFDEESAVEVVSRQFFADHIESAYCMDNVFARCRYGVLRDKVICQIAFDRNLDRELVLPGHTVGPAFVTSYENGVAAEETEAHLRPLAYRVLTRSWPSPASIRVDGPDVGHGKTRMPGDGASQYQFVYPAGTRKIELVFEVSRTAFADGTADDRSHLQPDESAHRLRDGGSDASADHHFTRLAGLWTERSRAVPVFELPDPRLNQLLAFTFTNQQMLELPRDGLMAHPAFMPKQTFWGLWGWDFAFNAIAARWLADRQLARGSLLNLAEAQMPNGCIPPSAVPYGVTAFHEPSGNKRHRLHPVELPEELPAGSQPPVFGHALLKLFEIDGDDNLLHRLLPALARFSDWLTDNRKSPRHPDLVSVWRWPETGQDNCKRWGANVLQAHFGGGTRQAWDFPITSVDGNVFRILSDEALATLFAAVGDEASARRFALRATRARAALDEACWSDEHGFYLDVDEASGHHIPVFTPAGFTPLAAGIPDEARYRRLRERLFDPAMFWTRYPLPSLAANDPDFRAGDSYWMGSVWLNYNHYVIDGLYRYSAADGAALLERSVDLLTHEGFTTSFENYNPHDGTGYHAAHFTWPGLIASNVLENQCGLKPDGRQLRLDHEGVPATWQSFAVRNLTVLGARIDVEFHRDGDGTRWRVRHLGGAPLKVSAQGGEGRLSDGVLEVPVSMVI